MGMYERLPHDSFIYVACMKDDDRYVRITREKTLGRYVVGVVGEATQGKTSLDPESSAMVEICERESEVLGIWDDADCAMVLGCRSSNGYSTHPQVYNYRIICTPP